VTGDGVRPPLGEQLELAVTVELVAEEIRQEDEAGSTASATAGSQASSTSE